MTIFLMEQIQNICRRQIKCCLNEDLGCNREENGVGKGENAGYQHFLLFQQCFQKPSLTEFLELRILW